MCLLLSEEYEELYCLWMVFSLPRVCARTFVFLWQYVNYVLYICLYNFICRKTLCIKTFAAFKFSSSLYFYLYAFALNILARWHIYP